MNRGGLAAILVICVMLLPACGEENGGPASESARPVMIHVVEDAASRSVRTFSGAASAGVETVLSFRVPGKIIDIPVRVGAQVDRQDVLARLDPTDFRLQAKEAEAALARARAGLTRAESDYERARLLYETENISRADLDNARAAYHSARAQVSAAEDRLELAEQQIAYTTLDSPIRGLVARVPVEVHQTVQPGTPVVVITSRGHRRFEIGVPDSLIGKIETGAQAEISFEALPGASFAARVIEVGVASGVLTTFPVTLELEKGDARILPGMVGEAALVFPADPSERFPVVPPGAIVTDPPDGRFVWVVDRNTLTVSARPVRIGDVTREGVVVREGLEPGDAVVIRGVHRIGQGQKVTLLEEEIE